MTRSLSFSILSPVIYSISDELLFSKENPFSSTFIGSTSTHFVSQTSHKSSKVFMISFVEFSTTYILLITILYAVLFTASGFPFASRISPRVASETSVYEVDCAEISLYVSSFKICQSKSRAVKPEKMRTTTTIQMISRRFILFFSLFTVMPPFYLF